GSALDVQPAPELAQASTHEPETVARGRIRALFPAWKVEADAIVDDVEPHGVVGVYETHHGPRGSRMKPHVRQGRLRGAQKRDFDLDRQNRERVVHMQLHL